MTTAQPQTIVFDVGNVLVDWRPDLYFKSRISDPDAHAFFMREVIPMDWHKEQDRGCPIAEAVSARQRDFPDFADHIEAFYANWLETIPGPVAGMAEVMDDLLGAGRSLHAITNFSAELWPVTTEAYPFLKRFGVTIVSGEEGLLKPDPAIFHLLLERAGETAANCIFIDDLKANVTAAQALGFHGIVFQGADDLRRQLAAYGHLNEKQG